MVSFSGSALVCYLIATIISILDSMGDYFACARTSQVTPPPHHAVNRGIFIEGVCSVLSGAVGCGHGTTTYGDNIGAISVTKVYFLAVTSALCVPACVCVLLNVVVIVLNF